MNDYLFYFERFNEEETIEKVIKDLSEDGFFEDVTGELKVTQDMDMADEIICITDADFQRVTEALKRNVVVTLYDIQEMEMIKSEMVYATEKV